MILITSRAVRSVNISTEDYKRAMLAAGVSPERADAFVELWSERRRCHEAQVDLSTHETFGVRPTTFAEFARHNAAVFRGEAKPSGAP